MKAFRSSLSNHMQDYLNLKESLGFSRSSHSYYLKEIDTFLVLKYPELTTLTEEITFEWTKKRQTECINTQKRRMTTIRELGKYLNAIGIESFILPSEYIGKYTRPTPYLFTDEELTRLFFAIDHLQPYFESPKREYIVPVLFRMMYCCGLRPAEPLVLQCGDVDLSSGTLFIRDSKGHRDRIIRMSNDLVELCRKFDNLMGKRNWFFPYLNTDQPCKGYWVRNQLLICWRNSGLDYGQKHPTPYDLRHNYATRIILKWLTEGLSFASMAPYLREYMGHSDFSSTQYYIHLLPENIIKNSGIDWNRFDEIYPEVYDEEV